MKTRRKKKIFFTECYQCLYNKKYGHKINDYDYDYDYSYYCNKTKHSRNLPRKHKKRLKKFINDCGDLLTINSMMIDTCSLGDKYKNYKKFLALGDLFFKYKNELNLLFSKEGKTFKYCRFDSLDGGLINEKFELELYWDSDYNSGSEEVLWVKDENSWTYNNMNEISEMIFGMSLCELNIKSFRDFLNEMKTVL